ncbi:MAG: tetratricopeptide repeat protein [Chlamydiales bacterium]
MKVRLGFFIFLFLITTSFFWEDEEKKLRQLHQNAELAMQEGDFERAKEAYVELIDRIDIRTSQKYQVDWPTYIDSFLRLTEAYESLGNYEEGKQALTKLLDRHPPPRLASRVQLALARLVAREKPAGVAYVNLKSVVHSYPPETWRLEDLSYFRALELSLDSYYDSLIQKAKRFQLSNVYSEAITLYQEILEGIEKGYYPKASLPHSLIQKKVCYHLAETYFQQEKYEQSLALLDAKKKCEDQIDEEMIYLAALCHREKQDYEKALEFFSQYVSSLHRRDLDHYDHALFEIGHFFYQNADFEKARHYFELLQDKGREKGKPVLVSALYLARIELKEKHPQAADDLLSAIALRLPPNDPLNYECSFLRGKAAYSLENYKMAKEFFEHSLASEQASGSWTLQSLYYLGCSLVQLGKPQFEKAEKIFKKLLQSEEKEAATLALARLYLLRDEKACAIELLLNTNTDPFNQEQQLEALLLHAEAVEDYLAKESLYEQATHPQFRHTLSYAAAWYARGVNHFQEGMAHGSHYFELAIFAFEQAFCYFEKQDLSQAARALKFEAKANFYLNAPFSSLTLLEKLLTQFNETIEEKEETLYLRGLIASRLIELSDFSIAEESLVQIFTQYPFGKYADSALHILATLYYNQEDYKKAQELFVHLANQYPDSKHASEAWFWAAESAEKEGKKEEAHLWRTYVYEYYPKSDRAAEAYFRQYPYADYFKGKIEALTHLEPFEEYFPRSPLLIVTHYLIGMNSKPTEAAKTYFDKAVKAFHLCLEEGKIPDKAYVYFRYQALVELATAYLTHCSSEADLEKCHQLLLSILNDFSEKNHPLTQLLKHKTNYPPIYEKSEFTLVQCYFKQGKELRAQQRLSQMLDHYSKAGIQKGYYLSQVWYEQGKLALRCEDFETGLRCFKIAEECGKGFLSEEQQLSTWIYQSDCYRGKQEYDQAIKLLSKAINTDIISPSRLKALYLRAEIYELQGRPELAVRQLEAVAKKGGEWAFQAREKLREVYGLQ